ncbi:phosphatase PAP2 family protein [Mucilaginibacter lacusdianchii]|uniref:phosphatase PAP2 family protein n=1 Tax=Mucilaginibacter lacusdianchii TaxID=2684211 RepID=UPI00131C95D1|nr:phosphatase PAP2 family protein [Mucilaginibacter sp. JXJ CY 39]
MALKNLLLICFINLLILFTCLNVSAQVDTTKKLDSARLDSTEHILEVPDTVKKLESKFVSFIPPAVFVGYGFGSFVIRPLRRVDYSVYNDMQKDHPNFSSKFDNYFQYVPVVTVYALNLAGVAGKNRFIDRTILYAMSEAIRAGTVSVLKHATHRTRPDPYDRLSFPSGHSSTAFAAAEFMAQEYGDLSPWYGIYAYTFATATAVLRVYNNNHWFSDIIAGAGFGILSTKAAYLLYPLFRNKLFHDKDKDDKKATILLPSYNNGVASLSFIKTF